MSDERDTKRTKSHWESLSTEELEELLVRDFMVSGDDDADGLEISEIMEVILEREKKMPDYQPPDVDKAWADFQKYYREQDPERTPGSDGTSDTTKKTESSPSNSIIKFPHRGNTNPNRRASRRLRRSLRYVAVAAVMVVMLGGVASAFGFNIFQAVANWSSETFSYSTMAADPQQPAQDSAKDPFGNLHARMQGLTDLVLVPNWAPKGTKAMGEAQVTERTDGARVYSRYNIKETKRELSVTINLYPNIPKQYTKTYQKDNNEVIEYVVNGITHYLTSNNGNAVALWTNDTAECMIQGELTMEELEKMVESIYEE